MSGNHTSNRSDDPGYSGKMTRQLVDRAEQLFNSAVDQDQLEPILAEMIQEADELAETERQQLEQLVRLMEKTQAAEESGDASFALPGQFELTPSNDRMLLTLTVRPAIAGGAGVEVNDILQWLKDQGVTQGVDLNAIRRAVQEAERTQETVSDVVVVRGRAPRSGQDARLERFGRRTGDAPLEPVRMDRAQGADNVWMCRTGDIVMRYHPPEPGEPGHTAMGEVIEPPAPEALSPSAGKNVRVDGTLYIAELSGVVEFSGDQVEVRKALIVTQDLTHASDPVQFDGDVHVRASVRSGASIRATGHVVVEGSVEAAEIESVEGDVVLNSGVAGKNAAVIRAGRDINARFAESASLVAGRTITLAVGSLHARLIAHQQIVADSGKGHLAGGMMMAGEKIRVKQLGARGGVRTEATVGISSRAMQNLARLDQLAARATQRRERAAELSDQIRRAVGDPSKLSAAELPTYTKLKQLELICDVQIRKLNERRKQVLEESLLDGAGPIDVLTSIMPNVHVSIGGDRWVDDQGTRGPCRLFFDDKTGKIALKTGSVS